MQHGGDRSETQLRSLADETRMRTTNGVRPWCDGRARDPFCLCPCPSLALSPDHDQTRRSVATSLGPGPSAGNRRLGGLAVACPSRGRGRGVGRRRRETASQEGTTTGPGVTSACSASRTSATTAQESEIGASWPEGDEWECRRVMRGGGGVGSKVASSHARPLLPSVLTRRRRRP